jgi:hypothetical protein
MRIGRIHGIFGYPRNVFKNGLEAISSKMHITYSFDFQKNSYKRGGFVLKPYLGGGCHTREPVPAPSHAGPGRIVLLPSYWRPRAFPWAALAPWAFLAFAAFSSFQTPLPASVVQARGRAPNPRMQKGTPVSPYIIKWFRKLLILAETIQLGFFCIHQVQVKSSLAVSQNHRFPSCSSLAANDKIHWAVKPYWYWLSQTALATGVLPYGYTKSTEPRLIWLRHATGLCNANHRKRYEKRPKLM